MIGGWSDLDDQYFAGTVPAKRQCVLNSPADQQSLSILIVETQSIPSIEKRARVEFSVALIKDNLSAMEMSAESQIEMAP